MPIQHLHESPPTLVVDTHSRIRLRILREHVRILGAQPSFAEHDPTKNRGHPATIGITKVAADPHAADLNKYNPTAFSRLFSALARLLELPTWLCDELDRGAISLIHPVYEHVSPCARSSRPTPLRPDPYANLPDILLFPAQSRSQLMTALGNTKGP
ncbi:uncharacterized protein FIBRA_06469 [Fibroporia radiculosa]|uniref:Uncharacterized protein n=1 Tax=Fibroporia radiculosa TaxID=599839 RepID=J4GBK6_9APHY|nr:uncharacterized protein FIBRA_06469 [Fibroporia radiculosa]CCM04298.1 predicted protein [Fibroporia radiculosa]